MTTNWSDLKKQSKIEMYDAIKKHGKLIKTHKTTAQPVEVYVCFSRKVLVGLDDSFPVFIKSGSFFKLFN